MDNCAFTLLTLLPCFFSLHSMAIENIWFFPRSLILETQIRVHLCYNMLLLYAFTLTLTITHLLHLNMCVYDTMFYMNFMLKYRHEVLGMQIQHARCRCCWWWLKRANENERGCSVYSRYALCIRREHRKNAGFINNYNKSRSNSGNIVYALQCQFSGGYEANRTYMWTEPPICHRRK